MTRHELQRSYRAIYRGIYVPKQARPTLRERTVGAWLSSGRRAVIALISCSTRPQPGLVVRDEVLADDELTLIVGLPVTTVARTAYDMGRHLPRAQAIARLDALLHATPFSIEDVLLLAKRHAGARGLRRLRAALPLVDPGAASPKETWLRLLLIDAGLPVPTTQIPVLDGYWPVAFLDMGWERFKVAVEYDGDHHRSDRGQYVKDQRRLRQLAEMGWVVIWVIAEDKPDDVVRRVRAALLAKSWRGSGPQPLAAQQLHFGQLQCR